jgi:hypothetical protein
MLGEIPFQAHVKLRDFPNLHPVDIRQGIDHTAQVLRSVGIFSWGEKGLER